MNLFLSDDARQLQPNEPSANRTPTHVNPVVGSNQVQTSLSAPPTDVTPATPPDPFTCSDDTTYSDSNGNQCDWYVSNPNDCGTHDAGDFVAAEQCCRCGGSSVCTDKPGRSVDSLNQDCSHYSTNPTDCGLNDWVAYDTINQRIREFVAADMCCACVGVYVPEFVNGVDNNWEYGAPYFGCRERDIGDGVDGFSYSSYYGYSFGKTDTQSYACQQYTHNPGSCGMYDDNDFTAADLCCACGGGVPDTFCEDTHTGSSYGGKTCAQIASDNYTGTRTGNSYSDCRESYNYNGLDMYRDCCACGGGLTICEEDNRGEVDSNGNDCKFYLKNYAQCGTFDTYSFRAKEMCCGCGYDSRQPQQDAGNPGGFRCTDLDTAGPVDLTDAQGSACSAYTADPSRCGTQENTAAGFESNALCCACFEDRTAVGTITSEAMNLRSFGDPATDYAYLEEYFNLPACDPTATPACTLYNNYDNTQATNMDTNFLTTQFSIEPVAGDKVFSYVELQDFDWDFENWGRSGKGLPQVATVTPQVLDASGVPIVDQPDFSEWYTTEVALSATFHNVVNPQSFDSHVRYAFFYVIPESWTSDNYPRPADLADDEDHTMRFSFLFEMGSTTYDTQSNDWHGEYTMVVEDPVTAVASDEDDADDADPADAVDTADEDVEEAVDTVDDEEVAAEVVDATVDNGDLAESTVTVDNAASGNNSFVEALQTAGELAFVGATAAFIVVFFVMPL